MSDVRAPKPAHRAAPAVRSTAPETDGTGTSAQVVGRWRALLTRRPIPFLIVLLLCELSPAIHIAMPRSSPWWAVSGGLFVVMVAVGWWSEIHPDLRWLGLVAPLLVFPTVATLRAANGEAASGFAPLLFLPVVWFALYGVLREVLLALAAAVLTLVLPILIAGAPGYPASSWRGVLLLLFVLMAVGPLIHGLVDSGRRSTIALGTRELQFRAAFEDAPNGMALTGIGGDDGMHFVRVNRALCLMLGRSPEELTSQPITAFTHPEDVVRSQQAFAESIVSDRPNRIEKRYLHPSGRVVWALVSYSMVRDDAGRPIHLVSQIEDVSARHESDQALLDALETERAATDRMREIELSRIELLGTVSHDLRTPITAAAGFAELLAEGDAGPLTDEQAHMLATVTRNLDRMAAIVDDLLALARAEGEQQPEPAVVDIGAVLDDAMQAVRLEADMHGLSISCANHLNGAKVSGDASRLERVLVNLLGNAVKFTPEYGAVHVAGQITGGDVVIDVVDTGIGIPPEDQERIFERFFRSPHAKDNAIAGTGLGLAIVRAIATQHGGTVTVRSTPGEGATFTLTLPRLTD